jgi:hypothetical protein
MKNLKVTLNDANSSNSITNNTGSFGSENGCSYILVIRFSHYLAAMPSSIIFAAPERDAQVAKLVDALCSGRSVRKDVLVRIQSWALERGRARVESDSSPRSLFLTVRRASNFFAFRFPLSSLFHRANLHVAVVCFSHFFALALRSNFAIHKKYEIYFWQNFLDLNEIV